jgi:hypothetical protein
VAGVILRTIEIVLTGSSHVAMTALLDENPQRWLSILAHCEHTLLSYQLPGNEGLPESLIWWAFLCYVGADRFSATGVEPPPARRFDFDDYRRLDYTAFATGSKRSAVRRMLVGFLRGYRRQEVFSQDFLMTFVSFFERVDPFEPEYLEIAQYCHDMALTCQVANSLPAAPQSGSANGVGTGGDMLAFLPSQKVAQSAMELFKRGERHFSLIYAGCAGEVIPIRQVASILLLTFEDTDDNSLLVHLVTMVHNKLAKDPSDAGFLAGIAGYMWNHQRGGDLHRAILLRICSEINAHFNGREDWWRQFGDRIASTWDQHESFEDMTLTLPRSAEDHVAQCRRLLAP